MMELLIVVTIIGILAAIAFPSYTRSIAKSKRAEARAELLEVAQFMQRFYSQNDRYDETNAVTPVTATIPAPLTVVPRGAAAGAQYYNISFVASTLTPTGFQIQAVPVNTMAGDICGTLLLNQTGQKSVSGETASQTAATCWR